MKKLFLTLFLFVILSPHALASNRVPSDTKASNIVTRYFNKYGKKFENSSFKSSLVQSVEIRQIQELQRNVATGAMVLKTSDGSEVPVIITFIKKFPFGWKVNGWEKVN